MHEALRLAGMSHEQFQMLEGTVRTINQAAEVVVNQIPAASSTPIVTDHAAAGDEDVDSMPLDEDQAAELAPQIQHPREEREDEAAYQTRLRDRSSALQGKRVSLKKAKKIVTKS